MEIYCGQISSLCSLFLVDIGKVPVLCGQSVDTKTWGTCARLWLLWHIMTIRHWWPPTVKDPKVCDNTGKYFNEKISMNAVELLIYWPFSQICETSFEISLNWLTVINMWEMVRITFTLWSLLLGQSSDQSCWMFWWPLYVCLSITKQSDDVGKKQILLLVNWNGLLLPYGRRSNFLESVCVCESVCK